MEQESAQNPLLRGNSGNPVVTQPTIYERCVAHVIRKEHEQAKKLFKLLPQSVINRIISYKFDGRDTNTDTRD